MLRKSGSQSLQLSKGTEMIDIPQREHVWRNRKDTRVDPWGGSHKKDEFFYRVIVGQWRELSPAMFWIN